MSLSFGGGSKSQSSSGSFSGTDNTNTNFTQNGTTTTAPNNPDWVTNGASGLFAGAKNLAGVNPQNYVAGRNDIQGQAYASGQGLSTSPAYGNAIDYTNFIMHGGAPQTSAATASPYISSYMDPYLSSVVNATGADMDAQAGQTRAQQALDLARSGAFGGSGAAITQALTEGQLARARATTLSGLESQGFQSAVSNAQQDAQRAQGANDLNANLHAQEQDRRLAAANQMSNIATAQNNVANQNINTQSALGDTFRNIQQAQQTAPLELQSWLAQQFSGLPLNLFNGNTQTTNQTGTQTSDETQQGTQSSKGSSSGFNFGFTATPKI